MNIPKQLEKLVSDCVGQSLQLSYFQLCKSFMCRILLSFFCIAALPSCSVIMASNRAGTDIETVQSIRNRMQLIALGAEPISSEQNELGEKVEVFRILQAQGSVARAFMHGLLDLGSAFLWELAGTPIESALDEKKYFSLKITFDKDELIKKIEL